MTTLENYVALGLSRPNFNLNPPNYRRVSGNWRFEMQFKSFAKIVESFFLSFPLARYINVKALRNKPVPLSPNSC